ncbi:MAG TPA: DUF6152 family protein [Steroidobacteraceae bacterium]|nr:DUF6152 family protein [Steroidobacteraceae bacterium]
MRVAFGVRVAAALVLASLATPGFTHHSVAGEFDVHKMVHLQGAVSSVEWANPHIYIHFNAKDDHGALTDWRLESVPVAMMRKAGLSKEALLGAGQTASVDAYPARDGTPHLGYMVKITYADGHHYQFAPDK